MSTEDKSALAAELLSNYKLADDELKKAKAIVAEAEEKRSVAVKVMYEKLGKGPFTYKGQYLGKVVLRGNTAFLRGANNDNQVIID